MKQKGEQIKTRELAIPSTLHLVDNFVEKLFVARLCADKWRCRRHRPYTSTKIEVVHAATKTVGDKIRRKWFVDADSVENCRRTTFIFKDPTSAFVGRFSDCALRRKD